MWRQKTAYKFLQLRFNGAQNRKRFIALVVGRICTSFQKSELLGMTRRSIKMWVHKMLGQPRIQANCVGRPVSRLSTWSHPLLYPPPQLIDVAGCHFTITSASPWGTCSLTTSKVLQESPQRFLLVPFIYPTERFFSLVMEDASTLALFMLTNFNRS